MHQPAVMGSVPRRWGRGEFMRGVVPSTPAGRTLSGYEGRLTTRLGDVKAVEISATLFRCGDEEVLCGFVQDSGRVAHEADIPTLAESERRLILKALEKCKGRLSGPKGAAVLLGINRSTRWSRTQKLGITREMPAG